MQHIILDGPDGGGKTTLAKELCARYGYDYHHEGQPPLHFDSLLEYYARRLTSAIEPTVFDRFHLGELVYGPLLRGRARLSAAEMILMDRLTNGLGVTTIICLPPFDMCVKNMAGRRELLTNIQDIKNAYRSWHDRSSIESSAFLYDYLRGSFDLPLAKQACPDGVIGSPVAKFLFVGDIANSETLDLPFFSTRASSGYLNQALFAAGYTEHEMAFTNARTIHKLPRDLAVIVAALPTLQAVIPLGAVANFLCRDVSIKVRPVSHPSFWKRFHAHELNTYVEQLRHIRTAPHGLAGAARGAH